MSSLVQAPFNAQQQTRRMELVKFELQAAFPHSFKRTEQVLAETEHSLAQCEISQGNSATGGNFRMPKERLRMSSHRGGSRGRFATQRPDISPSSSVEITSEQNRFQSRLSGRSNVRGRGEIQECGHVEHPAVRYRIPCTLENNTLIVSVTVEHCSNLRGQLGDLTVPRVDMQVPRVDMRRPTQADEAGPSEPVQRLLRSDTEDSKKLKGPVTDEPHTTDED